MIAKMTFTGWCVLISMVCLGCSDLIRYADLPPHKPSLVINGLFTAGDTLYIAVTNSRPASGSGYTQLLNGAQIVLEDEEDTIYRFGRRSGGIYSLQRLPETPQQITIQVDHPGYPQLTAKARAPEPIPVSSFEILPEKKTINYRHNYFEYDYWSNDMEVYEAILRFTDPGNRRYYGLSAKGEMNVDDIYENPTTVKTNVLLISSDLALRDPYETGDWIVEDGPGYTSFDYGISFSNVTFRAKQKELRFFIPANTIESERLTALTLHFYTLSEEYFRYEKAIYLQDEYGSGPFTEPVQVPVNVQGGLGIFAGRSKVAVDMLSAWQSLNRAP